MRDSTMSRPVAAWCAAMASTVGMVSVTMVTGGMGLDSVWVGGGLTRTQDALMASTSWAMRSGRCRSSVHVGRRSCTVGLSCLVRRVSVIVVGIVFMCV